MFKFSLIDNIIIKCKSFSDCVSCVYDYSDIETWFSNLTGKEQLLVKYLVQSKNVFVSYDDINKLDANMFIIDGKKCALKRDLYFSIKKQKSKLRFIYK